MVDEQGLHKPRGQGAELQPGSAGHSPLHLRGHALRRAPWTEVELTSIETADPENPTRDPVPYTGIQFITIPEWQALGDAVGRLLTSVLTGDMTPEEMQQRAQAEALQVAKQGKYLKN